MSKWAKRIWLNEGKDLTAFVVVNTELFQDERYVTGDIKIGDCNRMIGLDFNSTTPKEREAALTKLYLLQNIIQEFRQRLEKYHEKADK